MNYAQCRLLLEYKYAYIYSYCEVATCKGVCTNEQQVSEYDIGIVEGGFV